MVAWYPTRDLIVVVLASVGGVSADAVEQAIAAAQLEIEAPRAIEGTPPSFHAGQFDVGPFVVSVDAREGGLWLESPVPWPTRAAGSHRGGQLRARWRSLGRGPSHGVRQRSMSGNSPAHGRHGVAGSTRRVITGYDTTALLALPPAPLVRHCSACFHLLLNPPAQAWR
jgi:hypothetical protein